LVVNNDAITMSQLAVRGIDARKFEVFGQKFDQVWLKRL